jgi:uncharacterized protein YidB (DUF937 family)
MARGSPSLTALLGLLAVAGYQNRDKITEWLRGAAGSLQPNASAPPGNLGGLLSGTSIGDVLGGGLRDLVNGFKESGHGDVADSWVGTGPNKTIAPSQLEQALGPDVLEVLSRQTGLSREELLSRLSKNLPEAVDRYTPEGRLPTPAEVSAPR